MRKISTKKGFTLVEMIISLGIFTVVALVAVGALIKVMDANRKSISLKTSINNLNFALESMTREMRVGKDYHCDRARTPLGGFGKNDCLVTNGTEEWVIAFTSSNLNSDASSNPNSCKLKYAYRYISKNNVRVLEKAEQAKTSQNCIENLGDSAFVPLVSENIKIDSAIVEVTGASLAGSKQPKIFINIKGTSGVKAKDKTEFSIQTTISQRLPR